MSTPYPWPPSPREWDNMVAETNNLKAEVERLKQALADTAICSSDKILVLQSEVERYREALVEIRKMPLDHEDTDCRMREIAIEALRVK